MEGELQPGQPTQPHRQQGRQEGARLAAGQDRDCVSELEIPESFVPAFNNIPAFVFATKLFPEIPRILSKDMTIYVVRVNLDSAKFSHNQTVVSGSDLRLITHHGRGR